MNGATKAILSRLAKVDPASRRLLQQLQHPIHTWTPRPDRPDLYDEQASFVRSMDKFSICLGGTGSGKTDAAAFKTAKYVLDNPPPRPDTPFWVVGESYEMVCAICWGEKLSRFLPKASIKRIAWLDEKRNWPAAVMLNNGWTIEFRSFEQGRRKFQGRSIGGCWINEECPMVIVEEIRGRLRDYYSPMWADFTPLEVQSPEWPEAYDDPPDGWAFFHLNTECNTALAAGWAEDYLKSIPEDMRETRRIGVFASFRGQVFKEWRNSIHVIKPFTIPSDWHRIRGIDWGYNNPTACVWLARDPDGTYYVYDEHFASEKTLDWHAREIQRRPWNTSHPCTGQTYADHNPQCIAEFQKLGIYCTNASKTSVISGIEMLRQYLAVRDNGRPRLYVFADCKNLIREMRAYHWPEGTGQGRRERNPNELPVPHDDHAVDALRYAIYTEECGRTGEWRPERFRRVERVWESAASPFFAGNGSAIRRKPV